LLRKAQRQPHYPGVRGHRCYNSPSMRHYTAKIVEELAMHIGNQSSVIGWQIDNEFSLHECHCEHCNSKFREWLQDRYESIDAVNQAWGTVVWSGEYSNWSQTTTPLGGTNHQNPSYLLDYMRFENDSVVEFQQLQIDILRKHCPNHFITHNIWSYPMSLDYYRLCENLDFASLDYYPNTNPERDETNGYNGALTLDLARGIKRKNFWIMETLSGSPGCWFPLWRTPKPGFIRAFAWQCIAHGADTIVHFRWRSALAGAEQFWHGLIDHSNVPGRRFEEYRQLCAEVRKLSSLLDGTEVRAEAAILHSHEQYHAFRLQPQVEVLDYFENLRTVHRSFSKLGIVADVLNETSDLRGYKLIVAPSLFLLDYDLASRLEECVRDGATLVLTPRTGAKNRNNVCWMELLPGPLAEAAGVNVMEYDPVGKDKHSFRWEDGKLYSCSQWCDILKPQAAKAIAWYEEDFYAGLPAATVRSCGNGKIYYLGMIPEETFYLNLSLAPYSVEIMKLSK